MSHSAARDICDLPTELLLRLTQYLSFDDHARWLLIDRRHQRRLSAILYLRLLPIGMDTSASDQITRKDVLLWAIEHGKVGTLENIDEVEDISACLNSVVTTTAAGLELTPIHHASLCGHASVIDYLLQKGADVNASTTDGLLPMHLAKTGEVVHLLADHGGRLEHDTTPSAVSALTISISHMCDPSAVTALVQLGADPNHVARDGTTAAGAAIIHGSAETLRILLNSGVDANSTLPSGEPLLYQAIYLGVGDHSVQVAHAMAAVLLDRGASPNSGMYLTAYDQERSEPCHTPILFMAVMIHSSADLVQLLLEKGADPHAPFTEYRNEFYANTRLLGLSRVYARSLVGNLVAALIDNVHGLPDTGGIQKLKLLVQYGADVDTKIHNDTLLQYCLRRERTQAYEALEMIHALIEIGADVTHIDSEDNGAFHLLCGFYLQQYQNGGRLSFIPDYHQMIRPSPFSSVIDGFMDRGADPNAKDTLGRTPLMLLCHHPPTVLTAILIHHLVRNRNIDFKAVDKRGCNVLHLATGEPADPYHHEPCFRLQLLLNRGGDRGALGVDDVNAYNESGRTPLHLLLEARYSPLHRQRVDFETPWLATNKTRALAMLIRAGADVRARTHQSADGPGEDTPLHLALQSHELGILSATRLLLRHGATADINYVSPSIDMTPLMVVVAAAGRGELSRNTTEDLTRLLLTSGADAQLRDSKGRTAWDMFVELKGAPSTISPWSLCLEGVMPDMDVRTRDGVKTV